MSETFITYNCSACQTTFATDLLNKQHFKSELHRYNLKRRLINLPSVSAAQFEQQLIQDNTKSSTQREFRCDVCCKTFMSTSTYSQHIASLKHKQRRKELLENEKKKTLKKSNSSASSSFSVLSCGTQESGSCIICSKESKDM